MLRPPRAKILLEKKIQFDSSQKILSPGVFLIIHVPFIDNDINIIFDAFL